MANDKADKLKALKLTLDKLDKTYGKGTVMKMGDSPDENVEAISSVTWFRYCSWSWWIPKR